jgi:hypothetical protein
MHVATTPSSFAIGQLGLQAVFSVEPRLRIQRHGYCHCRIVQQFLNLKTAKALGITVPRPTR